MKSIVTKDNVPALEGRGKHSGKMHPPVKAVVVAKLDKQAQKKALACRKATNGDSK
jgi:hypothetical protein